MPFPGTPLNLSQSPFVQFSPGGVGPVSVVSVRVTDTAELVAVTVEPVDEVAVAVAVLVSGLTSVGNTVYIFVAVREAPVASEVELRVTAPSLESFRARLLRADAPVLVMV